MGLEMQIPRNEEILRNLCSITLRNVEHKKSEVREQARTILSHLPEDLVQEQLEEVAPTLREKTFHRLKQEFDQVDMPTQPWLQLKEVEPLTDEVRAFAEPLIPKFGEAWTACFYSRLWQARSESVLGLGSFIESGDMTDLDIVMRCLNEALGDANQKVLLSAAEVVPSIVTKFAAGAIDLPTLRELQVQLLPIAKALCFHMGDAKATVRNGASQALLALAPLSSARSMAVGSPRSMVMSSGTLCALILGHLSPKQNALGFLCRLSALRELLKQHRVFSSVLQEIGAWKNAVLGMTHPDAQVRKDSVRTYLLAFTCNMQAVGEAQRGKIQEMWAGTLTNHQIPPKILKDLLEQINPQAQDDPSPQVQFCGQQVLLNWSKLNHVNLIERPRWDCLRDALPAADEEVFVALCKWLQVLPDEHLIDAIRLVKDAVESVPLTTFELAMVIPRHLLPILLGLECKNTRNACAVDRFVRWLSKHKSIPKASSMVARQVVNLLEKEERLERCQRHLVLLEHLAVESNLVPELLDLMVEKRCEHLNGSIMQVLLALKAQHHHIVFPSELQDLIRHQGGVRVPLESPPTNSDDTRNQLQSRESDTSTNASTLQEEPRALFNTTLKLMDRTTPTPWLQSDSCMSRITTR